MISNSTIEEEHNRKVFQCRCGARRRAEYRRAIDEGWTCVWVSSSKKRLTRSQIARLTKANDLDVMADSLYDVPGAALACRVKADYLRAEVDRFSFRRASFLTLTGVKDNGPPKPEGLLKDYAVRMWSCPECKTPQRRSYARDVDLTPTVKYAGPMLLFPGHVLGINPYTCTVVTANVTSGPRDTKLRSCLCADPDQRTPKKCRKSPGPITRRRLALDLPGGGTMITNFFPNLPKRSRLCSPKKRRK